MRTKLLIVLLVAVTIFSFSGNVLAGKYVYWWR